MIKVQRKHGTLIMLTSTLNLVNQTGSKIKSIIQSDLTKQFVKIVVTSI